MRPSRFVVTSSLPILVIIAACSSKHGQGSRPNDGTGILGPPGGLVFIEGGALDGVSIHVEPDALSVDTSFAIAPAASDVATGAFTGVGAAITFSPGDIAVETSFTLRLPFASALLPSGKTEEDVVVIRRATTGELEVLEVKAFTPTGLLVYVDTTALGTFQAAVATGAAPEILSTTSSRGGGLVGTDGGQVLTVIGRNFFAGVVVLVDDIELAQSDVQISADGSTLTFAAPPHADGSVPVTVINLDGQEATLADAFLYDAAAN